MISLRSSLKPIRSQTDDLKTWSKVANQCRTIAAPHTLEFDRLAFHFCDAYLLRRLSDLRKGLIGSENFTEAERTRAIAGVMRYVWLLHMEQHFASIPELNSYIFVIPGGWNNHSPWYAHYIHLHPTPAPTSSLADGGHYLDIENFAEYHHEPLKYDYESRQWLVRSHYHPVTYTPWPFAELAPNDLKIIGSTSLVPRATDTSNQFALALTYLYQGASFDKLFKSNSMTNTHNPKELYLSPKNTEPGKLLELWRRWNRIKWLGNAASLGREVFDMRQLCIRYGPSAAICFERELEECAREAMYRPRFGKNGSEEIFVGRGTYEPNPREGSLVIRAAVS